MRSLSKKTQYTLRALYALTFAYGNGPVRIATLAKDQSIPHDYLENILLELKVEGIVNSKRGKAGGYLLAVPPDQITVGEIIRRVNGPLAALPCASKTALPKMRRMLGCPHMRHQNTHARSE